jgi:hypothetical protein
MSTATASWRTICGLNMTRIARRPTVTAMDDRVLALWQADCCMGVRLDVWLPRKVLEQAAEIDALKAEISTMKANIAAADAAYTAEECAAMKEIDRQHSEIARLNEIIRKQAERIAFLTPVVSDYIGGDV